ncbi:biotin--[acetyl-CoA-carboxylase] ligase [Paracraurococcus lichenis]|uniref:Biotin--[acetyl-CoA-carboxylase] ligase n=1 Tax=Paracraurococcus lichenis TaxID=3064888 RepID=A0ABT9DVE9_9PROT|nr:biotin--[acetyl-CoA-carboxylase] ligase [Paracraurococcus sp. LOR1-02]MDO9707876.1 biotin--[acetyl-CoA-carboxylase] ligase [Paracraurococcus sp. LOR1-02]
MTGSGQGGAAPGGEAPALPEGWRLEVHEALPSTSDLLFRRAEAGEPEGLAILARQQTAGRGRAGRAWASPPGNLYLSVLLRPPGPAREAPQWSLLAGVALAEAAAEVVPEAGALRLKWPNDLLRDGAKCAGILAESALTPAGGLAWISLGIGVNLAHAPAVADRPTATLGASTAPEAFAARLLRRLDHWRAVQRAAGFGPVRAAWLRFGPRPGEAVTLRGLDGAGAFAGLAEDGSLLIETDGTRRAIPAGEVLSQGDA